MCVCFLNFTALEHPKVVALGEFGLDDFWANGNDYHFVNQQQVFRQQLKLALEAKKPMVLHIRGMNSLAAAKYLLEYENVPRDWPIHMHAFTNSWTECKIWADEWSGMKFGLVSDHFDPDIVRYLPLDRILLETDAPYFFPKKLKGKSVVTIPGDVWYVANQVAHFKSVKVKEVLQGRNGFEYY